MMDDCCKEENQKKVSKNSGRDRLIPLLIGGFTLLTLIFGVWLISQSNPASIVGNANAQVYTEHGFYEWGEINIKGGNVAHEFTIENRGTEALELTNIRTSCMCTTAQIKIEGDASPYFGMHSTSSWLGKVPPGENATLSVIFDPIFHGPDAIGPIERFIAIETNDTSQPTLEFKLTGNVVK